MDRIDNGLKPACVTACPTGAVQYGTRDDLLKVAKKRQAVLEKSGHSVRIYGETELGGLGVMTILTDKASVYGLPEQPKKPLLLPRWLIGIVPGAVILYGMFKNFLGVKVAEEKKEKEKETQP